MTRPDQLKSQPKDGAPTTEPKPMGISPIIAKPATATPASARSSKRARGRPFKPGQSGNPRGRPPGSRNAATVLAEQLLDGQTEKVVKKLVERALEGEMTAIRLVIERILAPRRDRPITFSLPPIHSADDAATAVAAIANAVAEGELTVTEGTQLGQLVATFVSALEAHQLEDKLLEIMSKYTREK